MLENNLDFNLIWVIIKHITFIQTEEALLVFISENVQKYKRK